MRLFKKILFLLSFSLYANFIFAQISCSEQINVEWLKSFGAGGDERIKDIDSDNNGNIVVAGFTTAPFSIGSQSLNFTTDNYAFFVAKFTSDGNIIWLKSATTVNTYSSCNVKLAVDSHNNIFLYGDFYSSLTFGATTLSSSGDDDQDVFLLKLSETGNLLFSHKIGSQGANKIGGIAVDNNDNVLINGYYETAMTVAGNSLFPIGMGDNFVMKLSNTGTFLWAKNYCSMAFDMGTNIACDNNGNVYSLGIFQGSIYAGPYLITTSNTAMYLVKFNPAGTAQYAVKNDIADDSELSVLAVDNAKNVYVAYTENTTNDYLVKQYNPSGVLSFTKNFSNSCISVNDIITDSQNYFYLTGSLCQGNSTDFGDGDIISSSSGKNLYVAKYSVSGTYVDKIIQTLSANISIGNTMAIYNGKNLILGGYNGGTFSIDGKDISSHYGGEYDSFFMKIRDNLFVNSISQSSVGCDPNNMSVNLQVEGNSTPFTYLWNTGATTQNLSGVPLGTYTVTVTDNSSCTVSESITLTPPTGAPINLPTTITMCYYDTITINPGASYVSYLWSTGESSQSINVSEVGSYSLTVTEASGCQSFTTIQVNSSPNINVLSATDYYYCEESSVDIYAGIFQNYLWSTGSVASHIQVSTPQEINIRVFDGSCYYFDTIQVQQYPDVFVDLGPDKVICAGDSVLLQTTTAFSSYFWTCGSSEESIYASQQGYYFVQVSNENACYAKDSVYVSLTAKPVANLGQDTVVCVSTYTLNPKNPYLFNNYLWSTGETTNTINISETGTYWVEVFAINNACVVRDTIDVEIFPSFTVNIGDDRDICPGETTVFSVTEDYASILWSDGSSNSDISVSESQILTVVITNTYGCIATDTAEVFVRVIDFPDLGNDTVLCLGASYEIFCDVDAESYLWNTGATTSNLLINSAGIYSITITNEYDCTNTDEINVIYQNPPAFQDVNTDFGRVEIFVTGEEYPYYYSLDNMDNWQEENLFVNCTEGSHTVYVRDIYSCVNDTTVEVEPIYKVPSFFTPNGDGFNDTWEIYGFHLFPNAVANVFDRYGKLLFTFRGNEQGWDGSYAGQPVPADTYWYAIDFKNGNVAKGSVTIVR